MEADIERICGIWKECRSRYKGGGEFLFGHFTIADAMYAPVVFRFRTYGIELKGLEAAYAQAVLNDAAVLEWEKAALAETRVMASH